MVHPAAGIFSAISVSRSSASSDLGISIDESGDVGSNSEFYLITVVFHDQSSSIEGQKHRLSQASDMLCTLELMREKSESDVGMSRSELIVSSL